MGKNRQITKIYTYPEQTRGRAGSELTEFSAVWAYTPNLLRFLGNELRIPLVGVGTRDAYLAIRSDDQLENRFEPMILPLWEANDECCSLLASFAASLPLRRPSAIATPDMARYLLTRSEGTIGELAHLLMAAAVVAVESGEEAINHRTLTMADYVGPTERRRQFERELM